MRDLVMVIGTVLLLVPLGVAIRSVRAHDDPAGRCPLLMVWTLAWLTVAGIAVVAACGPISVDLEAARTATLAAGFGAGVIGGVSALVLVASGRLDDADPPPAR